MKKQQPSKPKSVCCIEADLQFDSNDSGQLGLGKNVPIQARISHFDIESEPL